MSRPLRILHISTRLILGGSQENTILSCEGQARPPLGHDVHLAFGPIYGPEGSLLERVQAFRTEDGRGITTHVIPHLVREVSPMADIRAYRELRRLIADIRPDVVHTHSSKAGILGRAAAWAERDVPRATDRGSARSVPARVGPTSADRSEQRSVAQGSVVVHTIHGPPFMPVEAGAPLGARLKTRINNFIYERAEKFAAKRCHAIVSVADAMTREFLRRGIGRPEQYTTIYSGMDTRAFLEAKAGEDRASARAALGFRDGDEGGGDFVVGTVARLAQHKGHDDILDALGDDLKTNPHLKLLWVGDGWWRERLLARAASLGARQGQIVTTGLVPPERVPMMMRAMDVLVHPSYREGLPRTVPQAQLCGVMPIAYDCDGTPEAIVPVPSPDATGMLVETGDRAALRDAVRWAEGHPHERRAIGERGRAIAAEKFSAETMVSRLEELYSSVLSLPRRPASDQGR